MVTHAPDMTAIVHRLLAPDVFPHEVTQLELLETHLSWVILTGPFAYKIKKPVKFDFVNYLSLERRRDFCHKELELNQRFAPKLYLEVVPIYETDRQLTVGFAPPSERQSEACEPIEYAVKMVQFPQDAIVASRLDSPELSVNSVERFGTAIADFHGSIESALPTRKCVRVNTVSEAALGNFDVLRDAFGSDGRARQIDILERWTISRLPQVEPLMQRRLNTGHVRRCHGDLHLKNVIQQDGQLCAFDGIEFNESFQWIDMMSEIAFPLIDFMARGRADLGWRFLNAYLEATGDYGGLSVLRFYLVYRALVRAKVTWLNPHNHTSAVRAKYSTRLSYDDPLAGPWDKYLHVAQYFAVTMSPSVSITHGFSGSGKSRSAIALAERNGWIRIRSDIERQRIAQHPQAPEKYSSEMTDQVYDHLLEMTFVAITSRFPVVIDATFLKEEQREPFRSLATRLHVPFQIIDCQAPFEVLCERIEHRDADPSEATVEVLKHQMETQDPLTTKERTFVMEM